MFQEITSLLKVSTQEDVLGPILFTSCITAVMMTRTCSCNIAICMFRFKMDATLAGRSYQSYGESFPVYRFGTEIHTQSLYGNPETFHDADLSDVIFDKVI